MKNPLLQSKRSTCVIRGGVWGTVSANLRSKGRGGLSPTYRDGGLGFRLFRTQEK